MSFSKERPLRSVAAQFQIDSARAGTQFKFCDRLCSLENILNQPICALTPLTAPQQRINKGAQGLKQVILEHFLTISVKNHI